MSAPINTFDGTQYGWLSNFWPSKVERDGQIYPTVEHAYQAAKAVKERDREAIRRAPTPGRAKGLGRIIEMRPDWDDVKLGVMRELLRQKFAPESPFGLQLAMTGDAYLEEGNSWLDRYWGVCPVGSGHGENHLGKLLMEIRAELLDILK